MGILIRAASLTNFLAIAERAGLDADALLCESGLSRRQIAEPEMRVDVDAVAGLLELTAVAGKDPAWGARMAQERKAADLGALGLLLVHLETLRKAMHALIRFNRMWGPAVSIEADNSRGKTVYRIGILTGRSCLPRQLTEMVVGAVCALCRELAGNAGTPEAVHFIHEAPAELHTHARMFGCDVVFGSGFNGIVFDDAVLDRSREKGDSKLASHALRLVSALPGNRGDSIATDVRKAIHLGLPAGHATIERIAGRLGAKVRTLQHRLKQENLVFSDLVNEERRMVVKCYLENPTLSLSQIAVLLGYRTQASFTHWFAAQYGMSPSQWRKSGTEKLAA